MKLTLEQTQQINKIGITSETIQLQFENLLNGPKTLDLKAACTVGKGIKAVTSAQKASLITEYELLVKDKKIVSFVPASGAATRMFKHLFDPSSNVSLVDEFLANIKNFAFYNELTEFDLSTKESTINAVLNKPGLNYATFPKAMISFHAYDSEVRKSIDEQLVEGLKYVSKNKIANFHFTISEEHEEIIRHYLNDILPHLKRELNVDFSIKFSYQDKRTDTVALTSENELVTNSNSDLLLRPGGHGALIYNLNKIDADIVFIKNIDNIVRENHQAVVVDYKKMLGSLLSNLQNTVFSILEEIENSELSPARLKEITEFMNAELSVVVDPNPKQITEALNKPIRVCGMVKNQGKAGGGPFWVGNSVQIVESAQMDTNNPEVAEMLTHASHFNPVDLVCGLKDYQGNSFDLTQFIDHGAFFVANKSIQGQDIKVLELPGLWNGAMANWITVFVEVPVETFHPVKTVNDLLQPAHLL